MPDVPSIGGPHRRYDPLSGQWVLVSAQRTKRPWQGAVESKARPERPRHDPSCYLCPGVTRASGDANPEYESTFVFTNDFPALLPDAEPSVVGDGLFTAEIEAGTCRVICFSPRHDLTLAEMSPEDIARVIDMWSDQTAELGERWRWVQVFENKGKEMGASSMHPHGQIWAGSALPTNIAAEAENQQKYHAANGATLLGDYAAAEAADGTRTVFMDDHWLIVVPYWAVWPYETLVVPRSPLPRVTDIDPPVRDSLAVALKHLLVAYDRLFDTSFPYSMGWHGAPFDDEPAEPWVAHAHFYPPLLRSQSVRKFMVGYELLSEAQRDITAEDAAAQIRQAMASAPVVDGG